MTFQMSPRLAAYLNLETALLILDRNGDETIADELRDTMDTVWHSLSDNDRSFLNSARGT